MLQFEEIAFLTGAGVSVKSGIPPFRGNNGLYDKKFEVGGKVLEPEEFLTNKYYS